MADELRHFTIDYKQILVDEIALEGLEGIGIDLLWRRVENRISMPLTEKLKTRLWKYIVSCDCISIYNLPEPVPRVEILDRFTFVDESSGQLKDPDDYLDGPYEYCPVVNEYGSCKYYKTRTLLTKVEMVEQPYNEMMSKYSDTLVLVASVEARWHALAPHMPISYMYQFTPVQYCILELVGKGRENGQMTVGKTNLSKILKDSKLLFYNRKFLKELDLVRTQYVTVVVGRGLKNILLRLKRFHKPTILSLPKKGKIFNAFQYLLDTPKYSENIEVMIKKGLLTPPYVKRLVKGSNIFGFEDIIEEDEIKSNTKKMRAPFKRRHIYLCSNSDESAQSDDETSEPPAKCRYTVGINLLRQAYERVLESGLKGLTQVEIAQTLGIEFYTSRTICRSLKQRNIVREHFVDKGRQRVARYIAVAATGKMDVKYTEEKNKLLKHINQNNSKTGNNDNSKEAASSQEKPSAINEEIVHSTTAMKHFNIDKYEDAVTEIELLDGVTNSNNVSLLNSKKAPTLRQLKYANGLLKILQEKLVVSSYQALINLIAAEVDEPPMDAKAFKMLVQKLISDGQVKIIRIKWPGNAQKYSILICAPQVKCTDKIIRHKYKDICIRAVSNSKEKVKRELSDGSLSSLAQYVYPRYMKLQKLHEFLVKFVYFNDIKPEQTCLPYGCSTIIDFLPEITVGFALGNINKVQHICLLKLTDDLLQLKLKDAPADVYKILLLSSLRTSLKSNLKCLAMFGLIQRIHRPQQDTMQCGDSIFYVNRHAKILDTTGVWPLPGVDVQSLEKSFYFKTLDDVKSYWKEVYTISTNTTIELPNRSKRHASAPIRLEREVMEHDNGTRHGDGLGPCGFDSSFFMELPRFWKTYFYRPLKKSHSLKKKLEVRASKLEKKKKQKATIKKKINKKIITEKVKSDVKRRCRKKWSDSIQWSVKEDNLLMMCKAAITIMSPSSQLGCLKVRNTVARDILSINDPKKTQTVCHKRALTLESHSILMHEKERIISEMRRRRNLIYQYENILKKLRIRFLANTTKFVNESRLPMLELVWIITQVATSNSYNQKIPCVAMSFEEFNKKFTICPSTVNKSFNSYKATENIALKEAVMLTIMLTFNYELSTDVANKLYNTFRSYPDQTLRTVIDRLRKCGAVSSREKNYNNHFHKVNLQDIIHSVYKVSASYIRRWVNKLNDNFVDALADLQNMVLPEDLIKGSPEINCLSCEFHAKDILDLSSASIPGIIGPTNTFIQEDQLNVLDIETKFKLKSGTLRWVPKQDIKTLSDCYPSIDYENIFEELSRSAVFKIDLDQEVDAKDVVINHLEMKQDAGSTFHELQNISESDYISLVKRLEALEAANIITRVGHQENNIILMKYIDKWSTKIDGHYIIATPWLNLDGKIRYDIFLKWAGTVLNKIFEFPGSTISSLSDACDYLTTRGVQDICVILEKFECVNLQTIIVQEPDLISDEHIEPEFLKFNKYESVNNIIVFPEKDSLSKYSWIRSVLLKK